MQKDLYVAYIYYEKSSDRVKHAEFFNEFSKHGIDEKYHKSFTEDIKIEGHQFNLFFEGSVKVVFYPLISFHSMVKQ